MFRLLEVSSVLLSLSLNMNNANIQPHKLDKMGFSRKTSVHEMPTL